VGGRWPLRRLQQANHVLGLQPWESTVVYADTPESSLSLLGELAKDERSIRRQVYAHFILYGIRQHFR
jgi:hypothetical protein